jgi:hypothetical protein
MGIMGATFESQATWQKRWPFNEFSDNLFKDFQKVINARGLTLRGPFGRWDDMTFSEKEGSDLLLIPEFKVSVALGKVDYLKESGVGAVLSNLGSASSSADSIVYRVPKGQVDITGRVDLVILEPLTKEKLWVKGIDLGQQHVDWTANKKYRFIDSRGSRTFDDRDEINLWSDSGLATPTAQAMEKLYKDVMAGFERYLDPKEMQVLKQQAQKIRQKKVY